MDCLGHLHEKPNSTTAVLLWRLVLSWGWGGAVWSRCTFRYSSSYLDKPQNLRHVLNTKKSSECKNFFTGFALYPARWQWEDFLTQQPNYFFENGHNSGTEIHKIVLNIGNELSPRGLQTGRWPKLGSYGKKRIFGPTTGSARTGCLGVFFPSCGYQNFCFLQ